MSNPTHTPLPWRWGWMEPVYGPSPHHGGNCVVAYRFVAGRPSECPDLDPCVRLSTLAPGAEIPAKEFWAVLPTDVLSSIGYGQGSEGSGVEVDDQDAAYIVHACNLYPELVAGLEYLEKRLMFTRLTETDQVALIKYIGTLLAKTQE